MKSILFTTLILFLLQACQVKDSVLSSGNLSINNYPVTDFQVILSSNGWKKLGDTISIELIHPQVLTVTGVPFIEVMIGRSIRNFYYQSGSGTNKINFSYTISSDDEDGDGITILPIDPLVPNLPKLIHLGGGTITYVDRNTDITSTLTNFYPPPFDIRVDGIVPRLESIRGPSSGNYLTGSNLNYYLRFSENVFVKGNPKIDIGFSSGTVSADYSGGSGTKVINFRRKILATDIDSDGFTLSSIISLDPSSNITISDEAGNVISTSITAMTSQMLLADYETEADPVASDLPNITSVNPSNLTGLTLASPVDFTIRFAEALTVIPTSTASIILGSGTISANYLSGSGSNEIKFRYFIQNGLENFSTIELPNPFVISSTGNIFINSAVPFVSSVTSSPSAGTYSLNGNLDFKIKFSSAVNVTGIPTIPLTLTTGPVQAKYISGTGTDELTFRYTVKAEVQDLDGINVANQIALTGGSIKDSSNTFNAVLTLPSITTSGVLIDSISGPSVLFAYTPPPKIYIEGEHLDFTFIFNRAVTVDVTSGTPSLPLNLGGQTPTVVQANYYAPSSTGNTVVFRYTVQLGDNDLDGLTITDPLNLNGGVIKDALNLNANLYFSPPSMSGIFVDGLSPFITSLTLPPNGTYGPGQVLTFIATYNEVVQVTGNPTIPITLASGSVSAQYSSGDGTNTLNFTYVVQAADLAPAGITLSAALDVTGATITDARNHTQSPLSIPNVNTSGILIDGSAPSISTMTFSPVSGTRKLGETVTFTTTWSEAVTISGNPRIELDIGGTTAYAHFVSCSSTTVCTFSYQVSNGHLDMGGIGLASNLINTTFGTIHDSSGNSANPNMPVVNMAALNVDGVQPTISSVVVSSSSNKTYIIGEDIDFTVTWSEAVTVSGSSYLSFIMGSETVNAVAVSGNGTTSHVYRYTVQAGDLDNNGITLHTTVYLSGGSILRDANLNNGNLSFTPPQTHLTKVDGVLPSIGLITPPAMGTYYIGENINFTFNWSEPMVVNTTSGTPSIQIYLSDSMGYKNATYSSALSTSTKMVFTYTVSLNDLDMDSIELAPIASPTIFFNGATIQDVAGNNLNGPFAYTPPGLNGIHVDGVRPIVTGLTSPTSSRYGIGDVVDFKIKFSSVVYVTGSPQVKISFGTTPNKYAVYSSGHATDELTFSYTVLPSDNGMGLGTTIHSPILLNGGSIKDDPTPTGNDSYLTFTSQSYSGVIIDGILPVVSSATTQNMTVTSNHATFKPGQVMKYILVFSESVDVTGTPKIILNIDGATRYATYSSGSGSTTLTFNYTVDAANALLDLDGVDTNNNMDLTASSIKDKAGNDFAGTFSFTEKDYIHYTGMVGRYNVSTGNYTTALCNTNKQCARQIKDLTGTNHLNYYGGSTIGPILYTSGFGTNSTGYLQFEQNINTYTNKALKFTSQNTIKYLFAVLKTPPDPSNTPSVLKDHILLRRYDSSSSAVKNPIAFGSSGTSNLENRYLFYDYQTSPSKGVKSRWNDYPADATFSFMQNFKWIANTTAIYSFEYENPQVYPSSSVFGGYKNASNIGGFNGQMAEFIYMTTDSNLDAAKIEKIFTQLNAIHGVY